MKLFTYQCPGSCFLSRCKEAAWIIGIAMEPRGSQGASEDLVALDVREWNEAREAEAKEIQAETNLLLDENVLTYEGRTNEYPDVSKSTSSDRVERNDKSWRAQKADRKGKRKMQKKSKTEQEVGARLVSSIPLKGSQEPRAQENLSLFCPKYTLFELPLPVRRGVLCPTIPGDETSFYGK